MDKSRFFLAIILSLSLAAPAVASTAGAGNINTVLPLAGAGLVFSQTGSRGTRPACDTQNRWVIDVSTNVGQAMAATLLTAYAIGKKISIIGTGTCAVLSDTEIVSYFFTIDS